MSAHLAGTFRQQAQACAQLGSPMYAELLTAMADDIGDGDVVADVLRGREHDPGPSALALRLLGGLHRLVLQGEAPALVEFYPSVGGRWRPDRGWPAVREVLFERRDALRVGLGQAPQTNEVGRSAALLGGLLRVVDALPLPVRLYEVGASAGLNLRPDAYRYVFDGGTWGPAGSALVLEDVWRGVPPPLDAPLRVVERVGSDRSPIDPTSPEGRLTVSAYTWPDQTRRWARLQAALDVAATVPATVRRCDAVEAVAALEPAEGRLTVLWHSVMWQYLGSTAQADIAASIEALGSRAYADAPFVHLSMEPTRRAPGRPHEFLVAARVWAGGTTTYGEQCVLGVAEPHGLPTTWE